MGWDCPPPHCPVVWGDKSHIDCTVSSTHPSPKAKRHLDCFNHFITGHGWTEWGATCGMDSVGGLRNYCVLAGSLDPQGRSNLGNISSPAVLAKLAVVTNKHTTSVTQTASYVTGRGLIRVHKYSLTNFQEISRIHFLNSRRFLRDKPYNIKMQVKFAMSISEHGMMSSDQCSSLCLRSQWSCLPEDFTMYSALKTARRAKITLLIIKFSRSINKIPGNFQEQF